MATQTTEVTHAPPHGVKRPHDDEWDNAQRLAKRFHLLNLEKDDGTQLWTQPQTATAKSQPIPSDLMHVDETKDRVYIHDLDAELAGVSDTDDEERIVFLPDIERRLNKVPRQVLTEEKSEEANGQEIVLYSVPHSLSLPEEQDSVRKAIIEARVRAREQQQKGDVGPSQQALQHNRVLAADQPLTASQQYTVPDMDSDAMDIG